MRNAWIALSRMHARVAIISVLALRSVGSAKVRSPLGMKLDILRLVFRMDKEFQAERLEQLVTES